MIHGALGLACGIVVGAVGAAILADWYVSRELARMTDRFLAVDAQPNVSHTPFDTPFDTPWTWDET